MQDLRSLETAELIDLLATHTDGYSRMLKEGTTDKEFARCSLTIRSIQAEIDSRKQGPGQDSGTDPNSPQDYSTGPNELY